MKLINLTVTTILIAAAGLVSPMAVSAQQYRNEQGQIVEDLPDGTTRLSPIQDPPPAEPRVVIPEDSKARKAKAINQAKTVNSQLAEETRAYEAELNDLAAKAQKIVSSMPNDTSKMAKNFAELGGVLRQAKKNLNTILAMKPELDHKADQILLTASRARQAFLDKAKKAETMVSDVGTRDAKDPEAAAGAIQMANGVKAACEAGARAIMPLRDQVLASQTDRAKVFAEIELYPQIFDLAIEACDLYKDSIGDAASYIDIVKGLVKARDNLRTVIIQFTEAAKKAEDIINQMPKTVPPVT